MDRDLGTNISAHYSQDRRVILGALSVGHGITHWFDQSFPVLLPAITASLGLTNLQVGYIATVKQVGFGLVNIPGGLIVDMFKGQWGLILTGCLVWAALFYILLGSSFAYPLLIVSVFMVSLPGAVWHLPAAAAISQRFPEWRGFAISIHGFGANVGNILGPMLAGLLLVVLTWRDIAFIYVAPALVMALVVWAFLRNVGAVDASVGRRDLKGQLREAALVLQNRTVLGLAAVALLRGMALNSMFIWTPFYLQDEVGMGTMATGIHMALLTGMGVASTPILGALSDRYNRKYILVPGMAISGILSVLIVSVGTGTWLTIVIALTGLFSYALHQIIQASVLDVVSRGTEATAIGFLFGANSVLGSFSPLVAVAIINQFGLEKVFYYQAALTGVALVLLVLVPIRKGTEDLVLEDAGGPSQ